MSYMSTEDALLFEDGLPQVVSNFTYTAPNPILNGNTIAVAIPAFSSDTTSAGLQVYRRTPAGALQPAAQPILYEVPSGPQTVFSLDFSAGPNDVTFPLVFGWTPYAGVQPGFEVVSPDTGAVQPNTDTPAPGPISPSYFSFTGGETFLDTATGTYNQRIVFTVKAGIPNYATDALTHDLCLLRSLAPGPLDSADLSDRPNLPDVKTLAELGITDYDGTADKTWTSTGGAPNDTWQYGWVFWRHKTTKTVTQALVTPLSHKSVASTTGGSLTYPTGPYTGGPANLTLGGNTAAHLVSALNVRIALGATGDYIIHLPTGDYGSVNLNDFKLPGRTILRSADWPATGAKFRQVTMERAQNIYFEFCKFDRADQARDHDLNVGTMTAASYCGVAYSDFALGPDVPQNAFTNTGVAVPQSWFHHCNYGISAWVDSNDTYPHHLTIHMNYFHGAAANAIWLGGGYNFTVTENVFADLASDDIQLGWVRKSVFRNNWGSRMKYPMYFKDANNGNGDFDHTDFVQTFSKSIDTPDNQYVGNVYMKSNYTVPAPAQGLFGAGSHISGHLFENNIILTNGPNALYYPGSTLAYGNRCRYNTVLRLVDDFVFADFKVATIRVPGAVEISRNVHCSMSGDTSMGLDGLLILMKTGDYSASKAYYVNPSTTASFYDLRPVANKPTHWAYTGNDGRQGAFQRFYDVIVGGQYPKTGPAAVGFKTWYDPANQIAA